MICGWFWSTSVATTFHNTLHARTVLYTYRCLIFGRRIPVQSLEHWTNWRYRFEFVNRCVPGYPHRITNIRRQIQYIPPLIHDSGLWALLKGNLFVWYRASNYLHRWGTFALFTLVFLCLLYWCSLMTLPLLDGCVFDGGVFSSRVDSLAPLIPLIASTWLIWLISLILLISSIPLITLTTLAALELLLLLLLLLRDCCPELDGSSPWSIFLKFVNSFGSRPHNGRATAIAISLSFFFSRLRVSELFSLVVSS